MKSFPLHHSCQKQHFLHTAVHRLEIGDRQRVFPVPQLNSKGRAAELVDEPIFEASVGGQAVRVVEGIAAALASTFAIMRARWGCAPRTASR